jgi:hypothetical protein
MAINVIDEIFFGPESIETLNEHINMLRYLMPKNLGFDRDAWCAVLKLKQQHLAEQLKRKNMWQTFRRNKKRFYNKYM